MRHFSIKLLIITVIIMLGATLLVAQGEPTTDCSADAIAQQQEAFTQILTLDFESDYETSIGNLYRLAAQYQRIAIACGYEPSEQEITDLVQLTLDVTDINTIISAQSVGDDVDAIMTELETVSGDSFTGQLLYTGTEPGLDGSGLACSGCHSTAAAPLTEGTWTRVTEERLTLPEFSDYTFEQYIVEAIIHPNDFIAPDYVANVMPNNYSSRLDIQMLADIIAYLNSQDQLLDEDAAD